MLDIKKAYLHVRVSPELMHYQGVIWNEKVYVMMTRMGFGISVAPRLMDVIVHWATREFPLVDNYVDDIFTPSKQVDDVRNVLVQNGLPTKEPFAVAKARSSFAVVHRRGC